MPRIHITVDATPGWPGAYAFTIPQVRMDEALHAIDELLDRLRAMETDEDPENDGR